MPQIAAPAAPARWTPDRTPKPSPWPLPATGEVLRRGFAGRCPCCGEGRIFGRYLKVNRSCASCGAPLGRVRADDVPPYVTIFIVGHLIVAGMLVLEQVAAPPLWVHCLIWLPLTVLLSLALLQPVKGAVVGLMFKLGMLDPQPESLAGAQSLGSNA